MRVFLINSVCAAGSTGHIAAELCRLANQAGDEAVLAFSRGGSLPDIPTIKIGGKASVFFHVLMTRLTDRNGCFSLAATRKLIHRIRAFQPDVIHLGNIHGYYLNIPLLFDFLEKAGIPVVWTLHDCWAFTGHCSHFTDVNCGKWKYGCHHCPKRGVYPRSWLFDHSAQTYTMKKKWFSALKDLTLVAPSRWMAECVSQSFLKDKELRIIANGIDLHCFGPSPDKKPEIKKKYSIETEKFALGVATPWDERKGLYDLIELSKKLPPQWTVVLVALTGKQMRLLPENMVGLGRINSKRDLAELYSAADVYVNPTYCDTFPTTNLEALACGTPVAAYNAGGAGEAFDLNSGTAVPMGDVCALSEAVQRLGERDLSEACIARASDYGREERFGRYLELYRERTARAGNTPSRVLFVTGGILDYGGISTMMFEYMHQMDRNTVQIDFAVFGEGIGPREAEAVEAGSRVFHLPKHKDIGRSHRALKELFRTEQYDAVHAHMDAMNGDILRCAKHCGVKNRISHAHNTDYLTESILRRALHTYFKKQIPKYATHLLACSEKAARFMYGDALADSGKVMIVNNAIRPERFAFCEETRSRVRKQMGFSEDAFVIGHIGRFDEQKNHMFLLRSFAQAYQTRPALRLVLVGDGALRDSVEKEIAALHIENAVIMTGYRKDIPELLHAFDLFVLPSKFEGLGIVLVEAQANGLPCIASSAVPRDAAVDRCTFLPLDQESWADAMIHCKPGRSRHVDPLLLDEVGYDIRAEAQKLAAFYTGICK